METPRRRAWPRIAPEFERREDRRIAATLQAVGLTFLLLLLLLLVVSFVAFPADPELVGLSLIGLTLAAIAGSLWLLRRERLRLSSHVLIWTTWTASTVGMLGAGGIGTPGFSFYAITIVAAGLLLGGRMAIATALLSAAASAGIGYLEATGSLPEPVIQYTSVASLWWIEMTLLASSASLIYLSMNRIGDALSDAEDSEQRLAERNLELSRTLDEKREAEQAGALLSLAMGQVREAILVVDAEREVRFANPAFEELTGRRARDIEGEDVKEFFGGLVAKLSGEVTATLATGRPWHGRVTLPGPTERLIDASLSAVVDAAGRTTHFVALARDVTREAALESDLRQSQKLEALGQLAGGVAHDFNNLLAVIQGYAEIVRGAQADPEMRDAVEQIEEASRQAASLTAQLLAFGRRQMSQPRVVDLNGVVSEADGMLHALVPENIEIETRLSESLPLVRVDPSQIHQVLLNLSANARDAMGGGGRLTIETVPEAGGGVSLIVRDDGEGMDEDTRQRIFEPFFTTKGPGEGTGLGLASVYGIVEQCGGTIEVESAPGRGTAFRLSFPATTEIREVHVEDHEPAAAAARAAVLVVEDQENVRRLLGRQLRRSGFEVTLAADGEAALDRLRDESTPIDVLVTDVTMPRMGGSALAERLRQRWPELRVLYISGYWPDDLVAKVEADPHAGFLAKPFSQHDLVGKIEALLGPSSG